jgi:hypothetical protein
MAEAEATSEIAAGYAAESRAAFKNEIKLRRRACNVWAIDWRKLGEAGMRRSTSSPGNSPNSGSQPTCREPSWATLTFSISVRRPV